MSQTLERTVAKQKSETDQLKTSFASLTKKAVKDKESLRKATQAQKLRAERFEAAIEKCSAQLKERVWNQNKCKCWLYKLKCTFKTQVCCFHCQDSQLAKARSERDSRRRRKEQTTDEREKLVAQIDLMKRFVLYTVILVDSSTWDSCRFILINLVIFLLQQSELAELTMRLQKERDELTAANERMVQSLDILIADNKDLTITNATLKVWSDTQLF